MPYKKSGDNIVYIYGLVDPRINEVFYIGFAENLKRRFMQHLNIYGKKKVQNPYRNNVINKIIQLGLKPEIKIIDKCEFKFNESEGRYEHEILEINYIKKYKNAGVKLTNLTEGGEGGCTGHKKVFQYSENGKFLKEYSSISEVGDHYGINPQLISSVIDQRGKKSYRTTYLFSSKEKANLFEFKKTKKDNIPIIQYSLEGDFIKEFKGQWDASRLTNIPQANISRCLDGSRRQAGGYMWYYKDNIPLNVKYVKKPNHGSHIIQYNLDLVFIKKYNTIKQASIETKISTGMISLNIRNIYASAGGYIWTYEDVKPKTKKRNKKSSKAVLEYDLNGMLINEYSSLSEAERINYIRQGKLSQILNGRIKNDTDFIWKLKNNNENINK